MDNWEEYWFEDAEQLMRHVGFLVIPWMTIEFGADMPEEEE